MIEVLRRVGFFPRACVWELTLACNLRCKHCGSIAGSKRADELSIEECLRVADELVALGCRRITLSGGEPTLYPGWHEVGRRLVELGARVNLISNGLTWSDKHIEQAQKAGLCGVAFSIDGFEKEHDEFRAPGSFVRVVRAIDISVAAGLPVAVNTTINRLNQGLLKSLRQFLMDHRVFAWQLQFATATGNMGAHRDLVSPPEDLLWLVPQIAELCRINCPEFKVYPSDDIGYFGKPEPDLRDAETALPFWLGCRAGCQVIGIESGGNVKGCLSLALVDAWRGPFRRGQRAAEEPARHLEPRGRFRVQPTFQGGTARRVLPRLSLSRCVPRRLFLGHLRSGRNRERDLLLFPGGQAPALRSARRGAYRRGGPLLRRPRGRASVAGGRP